MNTGKICVSVCAETAGELIRQIRQAEPFADIVEIRLDCLGPDQLPKALASLSSVKNRIFTYRPKEQGGNSGSDLRERVAFWRQFAAGELIDQNNDLIDLEHDLTSDIAELGFRKIVSYHNFDGVPSDIEEIAARLLKGDSIAKIAIRVDKITETISVWRLFEEAKAMGKQLVPIAMGEAGKWTRILGLAHGAPLTYASPGAGRETAPGQISACELTGMYRAGELNADTKVYGIIGGNTSYSMSPFMHNAAFKFHRLNSVFVPLQVGDLDEFVRRMVSPETREIELNFAGFAITNPHKQTIIKFLDGLDETAAAIGAVNTVTIKNGKLFGSNTDAQGFIDPLKSRFGDLRDTYVAVCGSGGAARACIYALKQEGADVTVFARNPSKAIALADEFDVSTERIPDPGSGVNDFDILVNATPLGTKGAFENDSILTAGQFGSVNLVYDLVYNPSETKLMHEAHTAGVPVIGGIAMLTAQAAAQQKIWTGRDAPVEEMSAEVFKQIPQ